MSELTRLFLDLSGLLLSFAIFTLLAFTIIAIGVCAVGFVWSVFEEYRDEFNRKRGKRE